MRHAGHSDARYTALFDKSDLAISISDVATGQWIEVSPSWERLTGYTAAEAVGKTPVELGVLSSPELMAAMQANLAASGRLSSVEVGLKHRDGRSQTAMVSAFLVDLDGLPCVVSIAIDVTEQARTRKALEESEQRYRSLVENFPGSAVILYDRDLRFLLVDGPEVGGAGITKEAMLGRTLHEALPPALAKLVEPLMRAALEGHPTPAELPFEDRYYRYEYVPLRGPSGAIERGLILAQNITARRRAELLLEERELQYRTLVHNLPDLVVRFDRECRFTYVSPVMETLVGVKPETLVGKSLLDSGFEAHRAAPWEAAVRRVFAQGTDERLALERVGADGLRFWDGRLVAERGPGGEVESVLVISQDVTEMRQREAEVQRKNDELTRFTYAVSHDLRSPLVTIKSFIGFLKKDIADGDRERVARDLGFIDNAATRMETLLSELLELSRIGRQNHPHERVPFEDLAREAVALVAGRIALAGTSVEVQADPIRLTGERARLGEVFLNLVDNAVKFSSGVTAPRVVIGVDRSGAEPVFFVSDNGRGIDPRHQPKLFGLFEKLDPDTDGTGVGLALVKRIIDVHGGRIWIDSEGLGRGASARFTLPGAA